MNSTQWKLRLARLSFLVSILLATAVGSLAQATLPNPVLYFMGQEPYQANGKSYIRYRFAVDNSAVYPDTLFAAAPALPPCGVNTRASRNGWISRSEWQESMGLCVGQQSGPWQNMVCFGGRRRSTELDLHRDE